MGQSEESPAEEYSAGEQALQKEEPFKEEIMNVVEFHILKTKGQRRTKSICSRSNACPGFLKECIYHSGQKLFLSNGTLLSVLFVI